jgi:hypothetical protein
VRVDQEKSPGKANGVIWQPLDYLANQGVFTISSSTLVVELTDNADEYVIADAIRIERLGEVQALLSANAPPDDPALVEPASAEVEGPGEAQSSKFHFGAAYEDAFHRLVEQSTEDQNIIRVLETEEALPLSLDLRAVFRTNPRSSSRWSNALAVFDYHDELNYKFAGAFPGIDLWAIGRMTTRGYVLDTTFSEEINTGAEYELRVVIEGESATLFTDGDLKATHTFGEALQDGKIGLATYNDSRLFSGLAVRMI